MAKRTDILSELWIFMRANKAYWITPVVLVVLLLMGLVVLGGTSAAPFIYTLF